MQRLLVLFDFGEATNWLVEAVVSRIVVALADFAHHYLSFTRLAIETMIEILLHADALTWLEDYLAAWLHRMLDAGDTFNVY